MLQMLVTEPLLKAKYTELRHPYDRDILATHN